MYDLDSLLPEKYVMPNGNLIYGFKSDSLQLLRLDFTFEAGSFYQPQLLVARAANRLFSEGSKSHSGKWIAEYMDFRDINVEKDVGNYHSVVTVYMLRKYADDFLPLLLELFREPLFDKKDFDVFCTKLKLQLQTMARKTNGVARKLFYQSVFGSEHLYGRHAEPEDVDKLQLMQVEQFYHQHYDLSKVHIVVSGCYDDALLSRIGELFGSEKATSQLFLHKKMDMPIYQGKSIRHKMDDVSQASIRVGSVLPYSTDDAEYFKFMVLNTVLGGYFGSRLMSNIREDKGYTYGIYSNTQAGRDYIFFNVFSDVGLEVAESAMSEFYNEIDRLCSESIPDAELDLVRSVMKGDFIRSIDGVFERAERFRLMSLKGITEQFTAQLHQAIETVTPAQLRDIAQRRFARDTMVDIIVS